MTQAWHLAEAGPQVQWWPEDLADFSASISRELLGEDLSAGAQTLRAQYADNSDALRVCLLALAGPPTTEATSRFGLPTVPQRPVAILGSAEFEFPLLDNPHLCDNLSIQVRRSHRRRGIGHALWEAVTGIALGLGRTTVLLWSDHRHSQLREGGDQVPSSTGIGELPKDDSARFALAHGHSLEQVERMSRLILPIPKGHLASLRGEAESSALPGYRLISWEGATPAEHLAAIAALNSELSTDAPTGGIAWQPQYWDADRVRAEEARALASGELLTTLAVVSHSGDPAGYTQLHRQHHTPQGPQQWNTVVASAHRGRQLGLWVKVANLQLLEERWPQARSIVTWNAGENDAMLAINTVIGFGPWALGGAWQLDLAPAAT